MILQQFLDIRTLHICIYIWSLIVRTSKVQTNHCVQTARSNPEQGQSDTRTRSLVNKAVMVKGLTVTFVKIMNTGSSSARCVWLQSAPSCKTSFLTNRSYPKKKGCTQLQASYHLISPRSWLVLYGHQRWPCCCHKRGLMT